MRKICKECGQTFDCNRSSRQFCSCACSNAFTNRRRSEKFELLHADSVWSCGAGIQSTAIAVLICNGVLPKPDYAFMADCGYESQKTLEFVRRVLQPKLANAGVVLNVVPTALYSTADLFDPSGHCVLPAFRLKEDGSISHLSTRCNGNWKRKVMVRWLREQGVVKCENWIGISLDERHRARGTKTEKWISYRYPLIDLQFSRKACVDLIKSAKWEMPIRTSCVICPQRTQFEWLRLKYECPEDFERACKIEKEIQERDPRIYLSSRCKPLSSILDDE